MRRIALILLATVAGPARAEEVMGAVRADRWAAADAAAAAYADPVVAKLVTFYRLLGPGGGPLTEIATFIEANPDWPQRATLLRRRDEAIPAEPDEALVARACDQGTVGEPPALERCADVYAQLGRAGDAVAMARRGFVMSSPDSVRDTASLLRWGAVIGPAEQRARFTELAWTDTTAAIRQLPYLTPDDRRGAEALLALRRNDTTAASLVAALPVTTRLAPEMLLETVRWLRRGNRDTDAVALWRDAGAAAERAAPAERRPAFWDERNILLRRRLKDGDADHAYALAADAQQTAPEPAADAAFTAGWIALRKLSDPVRALPHFQRLAGLSRAAITHSRAEYWIGRTLAGGDAAGASVAFGEAARFPNTFYGQLAALNLGGEVGLAVRIRDRADPGWTPDGALAFAAREPTRAAAYLIAWNEPRRAAGFLLRSTDGGNPADLALSGRLALGFGVPEAAVAIARRAGRDGVVLLGTGWPTPIEVPATTPVEAPLVLAVSRQESSFDATIASPAGARGLMQLMPGTAAAEAKALNLQLSIAELQSDPAVNVRLGSAYLRGLLDRYAGSIPLAVAAYNAGPNRVDGWITANGDPRDDRHGGADMVDWIEAIGFGETRNYVERVIENLVVYWALLNRPARNPLTPAPGPA